MSGDSGRSQVAYARLAGAMFLAVDALDALELAVAGRLHVPGDIVQTAQRITQSEVVYRAAVSGAILAALCTVLIGVGLYGALKPVDRTLALTGLVFRTGEGVLFGVQGIVALAFLKLYTGLAGSGFSQDQLSALVAMRSAWGDTGYNVAALFFSFGSMAFFYLFVRSRYIPAWLAWLGLAGSGLVPIACLGALIFSLSGTAYWSLWAPIGAAEIITAVWLLVRGLDLRAAPAGAPAEAAHAAVGL